MGRHFSPPKVGIAIFYNALNTVVPTMIGICFCYRKSALSHLSTFFCTAKCVITSEKSIFTVVKACRSHCGSSCTVLRALWKVAMLALGGLEWRLRHYSALPFILGLNTGSAKRVVLVSCSCGVDFIPIHPLGREKARGLLNMNVS